MCHLVFVTCTSFIALIIGLCAFILTVTCSEAVGTDFCTEQIVSDKSCFNQFIHNHFDFKGLPGSSQELVTFCDAYQTGMNCLDTFVEICLGTADKSFYERRMAPVRSVMKQLCSKSAFQDEFLQHSSCYAELSNDWNDCAMPIRELLKEEEHRAASGMAGDAGEDGRAKIHRICLIKKQFVNCTISATEDKCEKSAVNILLKLAETLSGSHGNEECPLHLSSAMQSETSKPQKTFDSTSMKVSSWNNLVLSFSFVLLLTIRLFM